MLVKMVCKEPVDSEGRSSFCDHDGCDFQARGVDAAVAAQTHTRMTGHRTLFERISSTLYVLKDVDLQAPPPAEAVRRGPKVPQAAREAEALELLRTSQFPASGGRVSAGRLIRQAKIRLSTEAIGAVIQRYRLELGVAPPPELKVCTGCRAVVPDDRTRCDNCKES